MAAPSYVYFGQACYFPSSNGTIQVFIPKLLKNSVPTVGDDWGDGYYNEGDDDATIKAKICDIFKLDDLTRVLGTGQQGFIGIVNPGSPNAIYHNPSRFTGATAFNTGVNYLMLNDGGLNTLGRLLVNIHIDNTKPFTQDNGFKITAWFRSAYYVATSKFGIKWRKQGDVNYIEAPSLGTLSPKEISNHVDTIIDVDPTDTLQIIAGNTYEILAFIENVEGTTIFQMNNVVANTISMTLKYAAVRTLEAFMYATESTYYRDRRLMEGSIFYRFSDATGPAYTGYYIYKQEGGVYFYYYIENGAFQGEGTMTPRTMMGYYGRGATYEMAVQDAVSSGWTIGQAYGKVMWWDQGIEKWYTGETENTLVLDGYYILSDSESKPGIYENYKIINGTVVGAYPEV